MIDGMCPCQIDGPSKIHWVQWCPYYVPPQEEPTTDEGEER